MSTTTQSPSEQPLDIIMITPFAPDVLGMLLKHAGIAITSGRLEEICRTAQPDNAPLLPTERFNRILSQLELKKLHIAQLYWERLDRRHLPVLVWYDNIWHVAERGEDSEIKLTAAGGIDAIVQSENLDKCPVIWVQVPPEDPHAIELLNSNASRLLLYEVLKDKRWLVEVLVATVVVNLLAVLTSLFSMQVYDRVVPTFAYATLAALVTGMAIMLVLDWALKFIRARILDQMAKKVDMNISQHLFEHVLRLRLDSRPRSLGSLAAQMNGLETVRSFFSSSIVFALTDMPFGIIFIVLIASLGGVVSLVYIILLVVSLLLGWLAQRRLRDLARLEIQRGQERHGLLVDVIQGAETIQSSGGSWLFADTWRTITKSMAGFSLKSRMISNVTTVTTGTVGTVAYVAAMSVGVTQIEAGAMTTGAMVACTILGGKVISPVAQCVGLLVQWQHVRESLNMANRLLAMETDRRDGQSLLVPDSLPDRLDFENVRFTYPNSPVMRLNVGKLSLQAGERLVLLGSNGCGKSTLLKIAGGLYKPSEGQVRLGGADIWELDPQIVNERVGYLPQDVHLFKGTLKSNICLGGGSDSALIEVSELLGVDRLAADNPRSMEMEISEGGQGLSGGQKQLVGLARVFISRPRIWLLDEPSASLDMESENRMFDALQKWLRPTDIVIIATHRPRLISLATRVMLMQRGQIIADGKPEDVLRAMQRPVQAKSDVKEA